LRSYQPSREIVVCGMQAEKIDFEYDVLIMRQRMELML
jgi:hypothetical protein